MATQPEAMGSAIEGRCPRLSSLCGSALHLLWIALPAVLVALAVGLRAAWFDAPLTADEGGYAEIARLWAQGGHLYGSLWVDRPQGLIIVFRALIAAGITSTVGFRLVAAGLAAIVVVLAFAVGTKLRDRRTGALAAALVATAGASPFIESFTLSGELLASVLSTAAVLMFLCSEKGQSCLASTVGPSCGIGVDGQAVGLRRRLPLSRSVLHSIAEVALDSGCSSAPR